MSAGVWPYARRPVVCVGRVVCVCLLCASSWSCWPILPRSGGFIGVVLMLALGLCFRAIYLWGLCVWGFFGSGVWLSALSSLEPRCCGCYVLACGVWRLASVSQLLRACRELSLSPNLGCFTLVDGSLSDFVLILFVYRVCFEYAWWWDGSLVYVDLGFLCRWWYFSSLRFSCCSS